MRISELSRRSEVPASTLRYYGQLGLLPAERTAAGYRVYDERARERLMFIEAAKRLRLSLPAIADLLTVWQSDACRAVKQQLRPLLRERLAETNATITELESLRDQLADAQCRLDELPDRDQRCDPNCAFLLDHHKPVAVLPRVDMPTPTSCSLGGQEYRDRLATWHEMLADTRVTPTADGFVATLALAQAAALTDAIVAEQSCCSFLQFTVTFMSTHIELSVAGPADAQSLIADLSGGATKESLS